MAEKTWLREYAKELTEDAGSHELWLKVMFFGLESLVADNLLILELIGAEAKRELARGNGNDIAEIMRSLMDELGLRVSMSRSYI